MEGIARDAEKAGETNIKTADEMQKEFNEAEQIKVKKASDWISQLTPQTGKESGAAMIYAHRCNTETVKLMQPKRIIEEIKKRIKSGEMLAAPLRHCYWWLTIGHDFVEKQKQREEEWSKMCREGIPRYLAGQGWDLTTDSSNAKWMCPMCVPKRIARRPTSKTVSSRSRAWKASPTRRYPLASWRGLATSTSTCLLYTSPSPRD